MTYIVGLYLACGAAAIYGVETGRKALTAVTKPATTLLLLVVLGWPHSTLTWLVAVGIVLSLAGDGALLSDGTRAFLVGLGCFLGAHLAYIAGFLSVAHWSPAVVGCALVVGGVTFWLL